MDRQDFSIYIERRIDVIKEVLINKGAEYAKGDDRLQAFKDTANLRHTSLEDAIGGMVSKQIVSLFDMIFRTTLAYPDKVTNETYVVWEEKLTDIIIYMLLLDTILIEQLNIKNKEK